MSSVRPTAAPRSRSLRGWLRASSPSLVPLAVVVGALTGLGAVGFRWLITAFTRMFTGYDDYSGLGRVPSAHLPWLGVWFLLLAPVVAGAVYGPIVYRFAPEARGHGVPEVMYAVSHRAGRIAPQVTVVKALASALCIGGGGSVGREGPIVQIGSAAGSTIAQLLRLDTNRVRLLVACGAAAGISATFNAPLAGAFFAMELILRDFAAESFGAVVLSSVTADVVGRALLGDHPFLTLPTFAVRNPTEYLLYGALGVGVGIVGVAFSKILYLIEDACDWLWRGPEWARPAVGGLALGALLIALPQMYGVGYPVLENAVEGKYVIGFLLLLMVGKMVATSLTIGIGGSGGVFAPTLFIGTMAGTAFGTMVNGAFPGITESAGAYGLIGMGAALGGATGAPITAVVILFELTGEYSPARDTCSPNKPSTPPNSGGAAYVSRHPPPQCRSPPPTSRNPLPNPYPHTPRSPRPQPRWPAAHWASSPSPTNTTNTWGASPHEALPRRSTTPTLPQPSAISCNAPPPSAWTARPKRFCPRSADTGAPAYRYSTPPVWR
jgi:chloride channel protein, CIC family